jgi:hypothetical protein
VIIGVLIIVRSWHCCCCVFDVLAALQFYDLDTVRRRFLECVLPFFFCLQCAHVVQISALVLEAFHSEHFGYLFLPIRLLLLAAITLRTLAQVRNDLSGYSQKESVWKEEGSDKHTHPIREHTTNLVAKHEYWVNIFCGYLGWGVWYTVMVLEERKREDPHPQWRRFLQQGIVLGKNWVAIGSFDPWVVHASWSIESAVRVIEYVRVCQCVIEYVGACVVYVCLHVHFS